MLLYWFSALVIVWFREAVHTDNECHSLLWIELIYHISMVRVAPLHIKRFQLCLWIGFNQFTNLAIGIGSTGYLREHPGFGCT